MTPVRLILCGTALLAAGTFCSTLLAAPTDVCLPVVGCVTTPTVTGPPVTVTVPTLPTTTTATTTPTSGGGSPTPTTTTTTTTATEGAATPAVALSVRIAVRVVGHGARRTIELRLRLNKAARIGFLLTRNGKALVRKQFNARSGTSVWRQRLPRKVKPGRAKLGLTYRSSTGELARSSHTLRLPR